jgi:hypothetical protein
MPNINEDELEKYVNEQEKVNPVKSERAAQLDRMYNNDPKLADVNRQQTGSDYGKQLETEQAQVKKEIQQQIHANGLGYIKVPVDTLPTGGLFYPEGTEIYIRAAVGSEIRHWSQTNETELTEIDDALNYMLERCLSVRMPGKLANYLDIKEIDRFYLILSIRDFTFPDGNNELMIKLAENKQIPLKKDNIDFIKFEDKIMRFYNPAERCFTISSFTTKTGQNIRLNKALNIYLPSVGVTKWLKEYVNKKQNLRENFDKDFVTMAPLLISDHRGLNDEKYAAFMGQCEEFGVIEYSLIETFKKAVTNSIVPKFTYQDEEGVEQSARLSFQGGFKSLFLLTGLDDLI